MKERPILFNGPMVRAILAGQKTVTRRPVKVQPHIDASGNFCVERSNYGQDCYGKPVTKHFVKDFCPYGKPGERLWLRESFQVAMQYDGTPPRNLDYARGLTTYYAAGGSRGKGMSGEYEDYETICVPDWVGKMRPSIHMPRAACRILLEITDVRVERLQDITEEQCRAEGITDGGCINCGEHEPCGCEFPMPSAYDSFIHLWNSTGGNWDANPWVWVVEFKRVTP